VVQTVKAADAVERVCAAGYGQLALDAARAALPEMATSASYPEVRLAVYRSMARWPVRNAPYDAFQVPEAAGGVRIISPRFIRHVHAAGRRLQAWTIDDEADMKRLLSWGVDGLISNRPDVAVRVRDIFCG
jgi:glycerophosphoryl diester phosphodiesterase